MCVTPTRPRPPLVSRRPPARKMRLFSTELMESLGIPFASCETDKSRDRKFVMGGGPADAAGCRPKLAISRACSSIIQKYSRFTIQESGKTGINKQQRDPSSSNMATAAAIRAAAYSFSDITPIKFPLPGRTRIRRRFIVVRQQQSAGGFQIRTRRRHSRYPQRPACCAALRVLLVCLSVI